MSASQNNWTPLGTPLEVILARRKKARAITITAAIAVDSIVSVLTVSPSHVAGVCSPTSISAARIVSVIAGAPSLPSRPIRYTPPSARPKSASPVRSFFHTGSAVDATNSTWKSASPNTTPKPAGRNT